MKTIFSLISLLAVFAIVLVLCNGDFESYNKKEVSDYALNKYKKKAQNFHGYWNWINKRRVNPTTGKLDYTAYLKAREVAMTHEIDHSRNLTLEWNDLGPSNHGGRTRAFLIDRDNPEILYAGGVGGGLWTSADAGYNWKQVEAFNDYLTVASICQSVNGDIYVGTGEGLYSNYGNAAGGLPGNGIYKSTDGAQTFEHLSSTAISSATAVSSTWAHVNRLAADPIDANKLYAATEKGVRVSTDGGVSWNLINTSTMSGSPSTDVDISSDGNIVTAVDGATLFLSNDGGATFNKVNGNGNFPNGGIGRIEIAIAPSNSDYIYASLASTGSALKGVYQSTDGGQNWTLIGSGGSSSFMPFSNSAQGQGIYDNTIGVSLNNPEKIFLGGVKLYSWTSTQGWNKIASLWDGDPTYYVHADMHYVQPHPTDPNTVYFTNDGGVFVTYDGGETFAHMTHGYRTMQLYSVAVSDSGNVMGGHQDNGTHVIDYGGPTNGSSYEVNGGDGGYSAISWINENALFAATPEGAIVRSSNSGSSFSSFYDFNIDCEPTEQGNCSGDGTPDAGASFVTPFRLWESFTPRQDTLIQAVLPQNPNINANNYVLDTVVQTVDNPNMFFVGLYDGIWMTKQSLDFGLVPEWYRIIKSSGSVEALDISKDGEHVFASVGTGGKLYRAENVKSSIYGYRYNANIVLADINDNGDSIYGINSSFSSDSVALNDQLLHTFGRIITSISVNPNDANHVVVGLGNYFYGQTASSYIYESTDALSPSPTFTAINGTGIVDAPVYSVEIDMVDGSTIYVGTEFGVYATENGKGNGTSTSWSFVGPEKVPVFAMEQVDLSGKLSTITGPSLFIGTHGRGFFAHNFDPCEDRGACVTSINDPETAILKDQSITVYPNPLSSGEAFVQLNLLKTSEVSYGIYALDGKQLDFIAPQKLTNGIHKLNLNAPRDKGIYIVKVLIGNQEYNSKLIRL